MSPLALCINSINTWKKNTLAWYVVYFVLWKKTNRGSWDSPSELRLGEWAYCMFPLLFFGTFYLWHLGQPPTHSSLERMLDVGGHSDRHKSRVTGFPLLGAHVMHCVLIFMWICLSAHFQGTTRISDWGGRTKCEYLKMIEMSRLWICATLCMWFLYVCRGRWGGY